jgi:hypothetical protein
MKWDNSLFSYTRSDVQCTSNRSGIYSRVAQCAIRLNVGIYVSVR